jgi:polyhydroxybutyrate depolymerase
VRQLRVPRAGLLAVLTVLAVLLSGGIGGGRASAVPGLDAIPAGKSLRVVISGGLVRIFHVYRPGGLTAAAPLVVVLHGGYGDGAQAERDYHWDTEADQGHFIVAYPNGLVRAWDAGSCCGVPENLRVDDVAFITAMVNAIEQWAPIDPARIYATGMSNGAMMALRLGCQTPTFAAIAPVAGTLVTDCSHAQPTSVLQIHGTADDRVPYDGGPGKTRTITGKPTVDGPSVPSVSATWRAIDACAAPTSTTAGDVTTETAACADGRAVELISVAGAGHQWPGGARSPLLDWLGVLPPPSTALDATDTIWQFFAQHHR